MTTLLDRLHKRDDDDDGKDQDHDHDNFDEDINIINIYVITTFQSNEGEG